MLYVGLAIIPALLLLIWIYTRERLHREPKRAVYRLYLLGAAIVLPAGLLERVMLDSSALRVPRFELTLVTAFFVAGMVEEFLKAAIFERSALDRGLVYTRMDSIIYASAVALGFATVENILYVTSSGFSTGLVRAVTAVPAHFMFGITMGYQFALSRERKQSRARGYLVPAVAHGLYDSFALSGSYIADLALVAYLIVLVEISLRVIDHAKTTRRTASFAGG